MKITRYENSIFGLRPIIESIQAGKEVDTLFIQKGLKNELFQKLWELVRIHKVNYKHVPIEKLNRLTRKNHQGVFAFISPIHFHKTDIIVQDVFEKGETPLFLILDRITDVRNFGAIVRSAECAGAQTVIIPKKGSAAVNGDALKTSAGALHNIPICREFNLKATIEYLKNSGLQIIGCTEKSEDLIYQIDLTIPTAIIMGSEEDGISPEYLNLCDHKVGIPMNGNIGSLNVSVSAGIVLYEALRQKK